jgi:hypothetical protein
MRARTVALALSLLVAFYLVTLGWRGVVLVRQGGVVPVLLGAGLLLLPVVGAWAVVRELRFGRATELLARDAEAAGRLPVDDMPRSPSGRLDRSAADAWFAGFRGEVERAPQDPVAWFRLACGYDAAGDRRRARAAMRHAVALHRAGAGASDPPGRGPASGS